MSRATFASKAVDFFCNMQLPGDLPASVSIMNPYNSVETRKAVKEFFYRFFNDSEKRTFLIGINPGRFGGGITGIAFTDPINLEEQCGITNEFQKRTELSSRFIYHMIAESGGVNKFFSKFFLTAVYPLALIKDGKNYNFYDSEKVYNRLYRDIVSKLKSQIDFGAGNKAICLGKKNAKYLTEINNDLGFFTDIIALDHPRYIMQYKLRELDKYVAEYLEVLNTV